MVHVGECPEPIEEPTHMHRRVYPSGMSAVAAPKDSDAAAQTGLHGLICGEMSQKHVVRKEGDGAGLTATALGGKRYNREVVQMLGWPVRQREWCLVCFI